MVQKEFKKRMGLRADEPLPSGGNSNDGNVACRAFHSPVQFAACTGIDEQFIYDLRDTAISKLLLPSQTSSAARVLWTSGTALCRALQLASNEHHTAQDTLSLSHCGAALPAATRDDE